MNNGRLNLVAWVVFLVGLIGVCVAPKGGGSDALLLVAAVVTVVSFIYAMYLGVVVIRRGDPWVRRHGESATAEVTSAKETSWAMASGEYYGIGAPSVWKYGLQVVAPGHSPYPTNLYICAHLEKGATIPIRISRLNRKRVAVDGEAMASA
jgi:hypothetical protein